MRPRNIELWMALAAIAVITVVYLGVVIFAGVPGASGFFGHSLGIVGFVLMLMTEVLYSLRKRYQFARWGKMEHWLSFHIITGLVGPYMVLLHTSWKFNGLAGILMLMTVIIVISGFIGRYFYTALPRSVDGAAIEQAQLQQQIIENRQRLEEWRETQPELVSQVEMLLSAQGSGVGAYFSARSRWNQLEQAQTGANRSLVRYMREALERQRLLVRQLERLDTTRRLLAVWHMLHVPLGAVLFTVAFVHIGAALYYATLLR